MTMLREGIRSLVLLWVSGGAMVGSSRPRDGAEGQVAAVWPTHSLGIEFGRKCSVWAAVRVTVCT